MSSITSSFLSADAEIFNFMNNLDGEYMSDNSFGTLDLCSCDRGGGLLGAGLKMQIVEPVGVIESTYSPWNIVSLGANMDEGSKSYGAGRRKGHGKRYHHYIAFAPFSFLNLIQDKVCFERFTSLMIPYFSEIIPTQNSDILANMTQISRGPLGKSWYSNPIAALMAIPDCAATTFSEPMNSLIYTVGCAGVTGNNTSYGSGKAVDPILQHHVLAATELDDMYFTGILSKTTNATFATSPAKGASDSMCHPTYFPTIIKTENRLQAFMPTVWSTQKLGMFRTFHADFKNKPGSGDDVASWVWRKKEFCVGASSCKSLYAEGL